MSRKVIREKEGIRTPTRVASKRQERAVAKALNGKVQPNSGATPFAKGDILTDNFLIECKTKMSDSNSISIKKEWIEKNEREALFMGKQYNALVINFGPQSKNYYVVSEEIFKELMEVNNGRN